jgi:hypothetical protein
MSNMSVTDLLAPLVLSLVILGIRELIPLVTAKLDARTKEKVLKYLPAVFNLIDPAMPVWLESKTKNELMGAILGAFSEVASDYSSWSTKDLKVAIEEVVGRYNVLIAAEKMNGPGAAAVAHEVTLEPPAAPVVTSEE